MRIAAFAALALIVHAAHTAWLTGRQPALPPTRVALQINGSDTHSTALPWIEQEKKSVSRAAALAVAGAWLLLFWTPMRRLWNVLPGAWRVRRPLPGGGVLARPFGTSEAGSEIRPRTERWQPD
ncbi:MAG: hypothetical protein QOE70_4277 [Chthoniobacter sp.]|nr:hypothetical protein [Chthoniobacter sp.]